MSKFNITIKVLGKEYEAKNVSAENKAEAEAKAKKAIIESIKIVSIIDVDLGTILDFLKIKK